MKKSTIALLAALAAAIAVFFGYRVLEGIRTDDVGPEISVSGEVLQVSVNASEEELLAGVTAVDDKDGDVTDSIIIESISGITQEHFVTVVYAAFDDSGNVTKAERRVQYTDYVPPRFTFSHAMAFEAGVSYDVLSYVGASDLLDGNIQRRVRVTMLSDTLSLSYEGTHNVQFQVHNSLGDIVTLEVPIEVYPSGSYNAALQLKKYIVYVKTGDSFDTDGYLSSLSYGDREVDLTQGIPADMGVKVTGRVNTKVPGVYPVSYTVSYTINGISCTGYSKLIVVVED